MSFSNSRYSSSPASLQRDYALLQGPSSSYTHYTPFSNPNPTLSEEEEEEEEDEEASQSQSQSQDHDHDSEEESESISHLGQSRDNLSQLSLPGTGTETAETDSNSNLNQNSESTHQQTSTKPKSKVKRGRGKSNQVNSPPSLKPTLSQSSSELSRSRGGGGGSSANQFLHHRSSSSSNSNSFSPSRERKREFPNYLLGGDPVIPPKEADLRSAEEIEDERLRLHDQESQDQESENNHLLSDHDDEDDYDRTPLPNTRRKSWLDNYTHHDDHHQDSDGKKLNNVRRNSSKTSLNHHHHHETTPLLSSSNPTHSTPQLNESGFSNFSATRGRGRAFSHGGVGNALNPSGWNTNLLAEPMPPGVQDVSAIAHSPTSSPARTESKVLFFYSLPIWGTHILELSLNMASVLSLGHLGVIPLAAASLSSMTANVTGYSIVSGFVSALDSLLPSAFTSQPKMVGLWTQRMIIVITVLLIPIIITWINAESILLHLGQDEEVSRLSGIYLRIAVWGLPPYAVFEICRRYLQAQGLMHAPTLVLFVAAPLNVFLNWLLVWGPQSFRLGFIGSPLASVISTYLMSILCCFQCYLAPRTAWGGWSKSAFNYKGIMTCVSLGGASTLGLCAEWWSWEIVGLTTSQIGTTALAAQSVLLVSSSMTYQAPFAMSVAVAVRVGNLLGASQASTAALSARMALVLSLIVGAMNSSLFLIFRSQWGYIFSSDEEVVQLVYEIIPILAGFQLADGVSGVAGGIMRGTGRQGQSAIMNLLSYYAFGIPIGYVLAFKLGQGLEGLWTGLTLALALGSVSLSYLILRTNWDDEVRKVHQRMGIDEYIVKPVGDGGEASIGYGATSSNDEPNPTS